MNSNNAGKRIGEENKKILDDLAYELATNYCTASFGEFEKKKLKVKEVFEEEGTVLQKLTEPGKGEFVTSIRQHRNILIIGAGATYDSYKCIPLGQQVINRFNEKYLAKIIDFPAIYERYKNYIENLRIQGGELDFENYLSFFAELLTPEELRKELYDLFNFRYSPSLFYEIVAHLFKHSFIDVIINFNFDELLDRAIEEELGKENYFHILSDGDCVSINDITVDGRIKIPVYIKPHGTISDKRSLKFTKKHYLDMPEKISDLLRKLVNGERGEVDSKRTSKITQVNIISVGFNMASIEFNEILDKCLASDSKFYHFTFGREPDKRDPHFVKKVFPDFYKRALESWRRNRILPIGATLEDFSIEKFDKYVYSRIVVSDLINPDKSSDTEDKKLSDGNVLTTPCSELFSYLWRRVYFNFKKNLRPRSIGSHEFVSYLFFDNNYSRQGSNNLRDQLREQYETNMSYFLDRTLVEIAISINRNNGIVEIAQLLGDRVGYYYSLYRKWYIEQYKTSANVYSIYDLVSQFMDKEERDKTYFPTNIFRIKIISKEDLENHIHVKLRKWELANFVNLDKDNPEFPFKNDALIEILIKRLHSLLDSKWGENFEVPATVLYYLLSSELLSESFVNNFKNNYNKPVYNFNDYGKEQAFKMPVDIPINFLNNKLKFSDKDLLFPDMLDELIRILHKSTAGHFYTIRPKYNDTKNYLTRSFSKSKILHTNLALEYKFSNMLLSSEWTSALIIAENGNVLKFLKEIEDKKKDEMKGRKIIIINSVEAIQQLDLGKNYDNSKYETKLLNEERSKKYESFVETTTPSKGKIFYTYSVPSNLHNHHMMVFIKKNERADNKEDKNKEDKNKEDSNKVERPKYIMDDQDKSTFEMIGALYMYRRGFSNSINPLFVGMDPYEQGEALMNLSKDFRKLLSMFLINLSRALLFDAGSDPLVLEAGDIGNYIFWNIEKENAVLSKFLNRLYPDENAKK